MYFSPQGEKIPKELLRLRLKLPCFCWKVHTHGSKGVAVLAGLAQATIRRAEGSVRLETPCPQAQGARRVSAFRCDIDENGGD